MPALKVTIDMQENNKSIQGFPIEGRIVVDEVQSFNYEKAADNDTTTFAALPAAELAEIQALVIRPSDVPVTLRLDGQTDAGIVINPGGLLILVDCDIDAGAGASNCKLNNPHASTVAIIKGLAGGT